MVAIHEAEGNQFEHMPHGSVQEAIRTWFDVVARFPGKDDIFCIPSMPISGNSIWGMGPNGLASILGIRKETSEVPLHQIAHDGYKGLPLAVKGALIKLALRIGDGINRNDDFICGVYVSNAGNVTGITLFKGENGYEAWMLIKKEPLLRHPAGAIRLSTEQEVQEMAEFLEKYNAVMLASQEDALQ